MSILSYVIDVHMLIYWYFCETHTHTYVYMRACVYVCMWRYLIHIQDVIFFIHWWGHKVKTPVNNKRVLLHWTRFSWDSTFPWPFLTTVMLSVYFPDKSWSSDPSDVPALQIRWGSMLLQDLVETYWDVHNEFFVFLKVLLKHINSLRQILMINNV